MVKENDNKYIEKGKCLFFNMEDAINNYSGAYSVYKLRQKILFAVFATLLLKSLDTLQELNADYLFPYPKLSNNLSVFVYGIGTYGQEIIKVINNCDKGIKIAGVSDGRWKNYRDSGVIINNRKYEVIPPEKINDVQFDYVIIAVVRYNMRIGIKKNLLEKGIDKTKIADINTDLFTKDDLDRASKMLFRTIRKYYLLATKE